jgi:glutamate--cysteine ligase catalytic subunit
LNGAGDFIDQPLKFSAPYSKSEYLPDYIVNPHPRFAALTCNIRERRGSKVDIQVPLYRDKFTPEYRQRRDTGDLLKLDPTILNENRQRRDTSDGLKIENGPPSAEKRAYNVLLPPNYKLETDTNIHMDAMGFGMGMCCLVSTIIIVFLSSPIPHPR